MHLSRNIFFYKYEVCWKKWCHMDNKCWGSLEKANHTYSKIQDMENLVILFIPICCMVYEHEHPLAQSSPMSQHTEVWPQIYKGYV